MKSVWLILAGLFWLGMNILLFRSEYGGGSHGNPLPVKTVISKILDTPDPSELDIFYQEKPVGHCRWVVTQLGNGEFGTDPSVLNDAGEDVDLEAAEMSGLIRDVHAYNVNIDGYVQREQEALRSRFMLNIKLNRRWNWTAFSGKVGVRNQWLHIHSDKDQETLMLKVEQDETIWETKFSFDQLKNPQALMSQWTQENPLMAVAITPLLGLFSSMGHLDPVESYEEISWAKSWNAFSDWMTIAHSRIRIYRLESGDGRKNSIAITVNRAGEIISVSAPQKISMRNENVLGL